MPYPNEHAARMMDPGACDEKSYRRKRAGDGVSLILCKQEDKMVAQAYRFDKDKFSEEEAKAWMDKHDLKYMKFEPASNVKAKLSMKASYGQPEVDGKIWSAGMHHVFVNDKPARVYVPEETIMDTFNSIKNLIEDNGRMPIGIDHLSNSVLEENEILKKMNLLDVGDVNKVGTDGSSIFILDGEIHNQQIDALYSQGDIPAYSIVGAMDAKPCPSGKADYVVKSIDVERVDFVQEGGCQVCKVGVQPDELILTSKKNNMEEESMVDKVDEAVVQEPVEEVKDDAVVEEPVEEKEVEVKEDAVQDPEVKEEVKEESEEEEVVVEEEPDVVDILKKEIADLKKELQDLGGKKPKVEAKDAEKAVRELIQAGKALPKMKAGLIATYEADPDAFEQLAASMPKMVKMETKAKLAKVKKEERAAKEAEQAESAQKAMAEKYFGVKL